MRPGIYIVTPLPLPTTVLLLLIPTTTGAITYITMTIFTRRYLRWVTTVTSPFTVPLHLWLHETLPLSLWLLALVLMNSGAEREPMYLHMSGTSRTFFSSSFQMYLIPTADKTRAPIWSQRNDNSTRQKSDHMGAHTEWLSLLEKIPCFELVGGVVRLHCTKNNPI